VDFHLSAKRDVAAAKAFLRKAIKDQGSAPTTIALDGYAASHRAAREMTADGPLPTGTKLRSSKYLNNLIEQDHRGVKLRIGPMLGFTRLSTPAVTIAGIELLRRIHKGQFNLGSLRIKDNCLRVSGTAKMPQVDKRVRHQFHAVVPLLDELEWQQQSLEFILPGKGPLHAKS
jgi:transposase-like protein